MSNQRTDQHELKGAGYEMFIGALSVLSILNLILLLALEGQNLRRVLFVMDAVLSAIFLGDFIYRLRSTANKMEYFFKRFGWADLLASLPFEHAKVLRIFRVVRVSRLMRADGWAKTKQTLARDRAENALLTLVLLGLLVLEFGSLWILHIEELAKGANITTASDALWYVIVTISTVGYGDRYPVTAEGRIIGVVIIIVGVGIFGTFTGYLANAFLAPRRDTNTGAKQGSSAAMQRAEKFTELQELLVAQQRTIDELQALQKD
jgi:voltage-gated potassium channel